MLCVSSISKILASMSLWDGSRPFTRRVLQFESVFYLGCVITTQTCEYFYNSSMQSLRRFNESHKRGWSMILLRKHVSTSITAKCRICVDLMKVIKEAV
jgi:hypothetical protein